MIVLAERDARIEADAVTMRDLRDKVLLAAIDLGTVTGQRGGQLDALRAQNAAQAEEIERLKNEVSGCVKHGYLVQKTKAENAELRAWVETLEGLIVTEECIGGECSTIPHATEICSEARAIRARREAGR